MDRRDLAARALAHRRRAARVDGGRRRRVRRAAGLDRAFLSRRRSTMTTRGRAPACPWTGRSRPSPGGPAARARRRVRRSPGVVRAQPVGFAPTQRLSATTGGSTQTHRAREGARAARTGTRRRSPARCARWRAAGPACCSPSRRRRTCTPRPATRSRSAAPGSAPATVRVDGVVELPAADSLFQTVGAPPGAQASAPPDNVVLLPAATFDALGAARRRRPRSTPALDPRAARAARAPPTTRCTGAAPQPRDAARRRRASSGDNLGTALDQARKDALYAQLLFLFLGLPGAMLAGLVTATIASAGAGRRRRDARCCARAAPRPASWCGSPSAEAALAGAASASRSGSRAALAIGASAFGRRASARRALAAVAVGGGAALAGSPSPRGAIALPGLARRPRPDRRRPAARGRRARRARRGGSAAGSTSLALVGAGLVFWQASRGGYKLVLAPEGVAQVSVNWYALLAPVLVWVGAGLLVVPARRRRARARPRAAGPGAAAAGRRARADGRGRRWAASAGCWPARSRSSRWPPRSRGSTAIFNATYQQQAEVDARLTNGADVTVTESPGASVGPASAAQLARVPGVHGVEPLQHRFAYVGADLQDLYGVRPGTIGAAGQAAGRLVRRRDRRRADAHARRAAGRRARLGRDRPDFQLRPGDPLRLRLQDGRTKRARHGPVPLRGRGQGVPDRADGLVPGRQRRLRRPGDRQRCRRLVPRADRRDESRGRRRRVCGAGRDRRGGHGHRDSAARRRLRI